MEAQVRMTSRGQRSNGLERYRHERNALKMNNWKSDQCAVTEYVSRRVSLWESFLTCMVLLSAAGFMCADEAYGTDAEKYSSPSMFIALFFWEPFKIYYGPHLESFFIVAMLSPNEHSSSPDVAYIMSLT